MFFDKKVKMNWSFTLSILNISILNYRRFECNSQTLKWNANICSDNLVSIVASYGVIALYNPITFYLFISNNPSHSKEYKGVEIGSSIGCTEYIKTQLFRCACHAGRMTICHHVYTFGSPYCTRVHYGVVFDFL